METYYFPKYAVSQYTYSRKIGNEIELNTKRTVFVGLKLYQTINGEKNGVRKRKQCVSECGPTIVLTETVVQLCRNILENQNEKKADLHALCFRKNTSVPTREDSFVCVYTSG